MREGAPDWIDQALVELLDGGLWHATSETGFQGICQDRQIKPNVPGGHKNAFCRSLSAVSLFDLSRPDSAAPQAAEHWSSWLKAWDGGPSFWFEIDREQAAANLLSPEEVRAQWKIAVDAHNPNVRLIAGIEAAHLGAIPSACIKRCLKVEGEEWKPISFA